MKSIGKPVVSRRSAVVLACSLFAALLPMGSVMSQALASGPRPVVVSVRLERGTLIYRLNGRRIEDRANNSLLTNLGRTVEERGTGATVFIVIDVRAPFSAVGKVETALDKVGLTHYRLFVSNFRGGIMNEIHWDETPIPLPPSY